VPKHHTMETNGGGGGDKAPHIPNLGTQ